MERLDVPIRQRLYRHYLNNNNNIDQISEWSKRTIIKREKEPSKCVCDGDADERESGAMDEWGPREGKREESARGELEKGRENYAQ